MCVHVGSLWGTTHDAGKDGSAIEEWRHNEGNRKGVKTDTSAFMEDGRATITNCNGNATFKELKQTSDVNHRTVNVTK